MILKGYLSLLISLGLTVAPAVAVAATLAWSNVAVVGLGVAAAGTVNVWVAPNLPDQQYVKPAISFVLMALLAVQQVIGSGGFRAVTVGQWIMIAAAAFAAIGITAFPNSPPTLASSRASVTR